MVQYRTVKKEEVCRELFHAFIRHQIVTKCWRRPQGEWVIQDASFIDDWSEEEYKELVEDLRDTIERGGFVYAGFCEGALKGFVSVRAGLFGEEQRYLDVSNLHVSEDMRGQKIGKTLFLAAKAWAKQQGARKLYLSAHSAVESQAFYRAMGCVEAERYNQEHVEKEPYDCQLECEV